MGDLSQDDRAAILTAIRRITAANGGIPPGVRRFGHLSGFRYRWQKYWLRWSDAVREAGFTPNSIQPRLEDSKMLEAAAALARELGRVPGFDDITRYKRLGRELPAHTSYIAHFGGKHGLLAKLKRWTDQDAERADVAAMIAKLKQGPGATVIALKSSRRMSAGQERCDGHERSSADQSRTSLSSSRCRHRRAAASVSRPRE